MNTSVQSLCLEELSDTGNGMDVAVNAWKH